MRRLVAGVVLWLVAAASAAAQQPVVVGSSQGYAEARTRSADQTSNPEYQRLAAPAYQAALNKSPGWEDLLATDPFLADWGGTRGRLIAVRLRNRYGASLRATLFAPLHPAGRRPLVLLLTGGASDEQPYRGLTEGLAEHGYIVMAIEAQGDGGSDVRPPDEATYCHPGAWQQPQELGLREEGPCAGVQPPETFDPTANPQALASGDLDWSALQADYDHAATRKVFAAFDAMRWLRTDADPLRDEIDFARVGIMGHSYGAYSALLAANGDPEHRFRAAVPLDTLGRMTTVAPRVPTLFVFEDFAFPTPRVAPPTADTHNGIFNADRFRAAGVPMQSVTPLGLTHNDFLYMPWTAEAVGETIAPGPPLCALTQCAQSRYGERVSLYYVQAWFDRWLKRGARTHDRARRRLLAATYDASVDGSSIGVGTYDPLRGNVPYTIAGRTTADRLSRTYPSYAAFDGVACQDLRAGCH